MHNWKKCEFWFATIQILAFSLQATEDRIHFSAAQIFKIGMHLIPSVGRQHFSYITRQLIVNEILLRF